MAEVDGYTKSGADATFAPIAHTHAGGGGSAIGGIMVFQGLTYNYLNTAGKGTQLKPATWQLVDGYSHGPDGSYGAPTTPFAYIDETDNRLYCAVAGWYMIRMNWRVDFPNSVPSIIMSYLNVNGLDPKSSQYHPAGPSRPNDFTYEGNFPNSIPSTVGEHVLSPFFCDVDSWFVEPALWWNTQDDVVAGTTYPGAVPTLQIQLTKIA